MPETSFNVATTGCLEPQGRRRLLLGRTASEATWVRVHPMVPASFHAPKTEQAEVVDRTEVQRLHEGCRTSTYRVVVQRLEFLMKITQQWLVSEPEWKGEASANVTSASQQQQQPGKPPPLNNLLQVFPPSHFLTGLRGIGRYTAQDESGKALHPAGGETIARSAKTIHEHLVAGSWFLFAFLARSYVLLKLIILAAILSRRDYLRGHIELDVRPNATTSDDGLCVLKEDIRLVGDSLARFKEHEQLTRWVQFVGASFLSVPGLASLLTGLSSSLPMTFFAAAIIYFRLHPVRIDHLYFIFDPVGERRRIKHELDTIVKELIGSLSRRDATISSCSAYNRRSSCRLPGPPSHQNKRLMIARDEQESWLERMRFVQLLILVNQLQLVRPHYVTSEWHKKFVSLTDRLIWLLFLVTYVACTFIFVCLIARDLYETTRLRVAQLACRQWNPNATQMTMLDSAHLEPLDEPALAVAYESHDGSIVSLLRLALTVEAANYFSLARMVFLLETYVGIAYMCLWGTLAGVVYLNGIMNKIVWLRQLEKEINLAADESADHLGRSTKSKSQLDDSENNLRKTLTVAYLHYQLFRRQERVFQVFIHCTLVRSIALIATSCLILYLMALNVKTLNRIVLMYVYILLLSFFNLFLLASSYKAKQVERIKCKVEQIVAHCANSQSLQMSYALELWRRRLHYDHVEPDLFGIHVSYEHVISFNAYTVATFLLLIRVISYNT